MVKCSCSNPNNNTIGGPREEWHKRGCAATPSLVQYEMSLKPGPE